MTIFVPSCLCASIFNGTFVSSVDFLLAQRHEGTKGLRNETSAVILSNII
jgi:hypothetical protein